MFDLEQAIAEMPEGGSLTSCANRSVFNALRENYVQWPFGSPEEVFAAADMAHQLHPELRITMDHTALEVTVYWTPYFK